MFLVDLVKKITGATRKDSQWLSKMTEEEIRKVEIVRIHEEGSFTQKNLCITISYYNLTDSGRSNLKYVSVAHPSYRPFGNLQKEPVKLNEARYNLVNNWKTLLEKGGKESYTIHLGNQSDLADYIRYVG